ncbi:MAG TPA: hypothetical protein VG710_00715 [Opitutus sp.]|nr:hypothetical protein [Opitutus sp.]
MTLRSRTCITFLLLWALATTSAHALLNFNDGTDLVFVTGTYSIGFDTNVFTRAVSKQSTTQSASISVDYSRVAGVITVNANVSASAGSFGSIRGQDFADPSFSLAFRKRYGRTTGTLSLTTRRESQPDPDAGERTHDAYYSSDLDLRYPVNDRYYFTNALGYSWKDYLNQPAFSNLTTLNDSFAVNYVYDSKLDLNAGYVFSLNDTSKDTHAFDQSLLIGASGSILPKLSGTLSVGIQQRSSDSKIGGREKFTSFTSATSLKWLFSRRISFNGELNEDFSTTSTDITVNRLSGGIHGTASLSTRYICSAGVTDTISYYLGKAGYITGTTTDREDNLLQFDVSLGVAITTHIRTTLAYVYMLNTSNDSSASFTRQLLTLTIAATY